MKISLQGTKSSTFQPEDHLSCFVFATAHAFYVGSPSPLPLVLPLIFCKLQQLFFFVLREPSFALCVSFFNFEFGLACVCVRFGRLHINLHLFTTVCRFMCVRIFGSVLQLPNLTMDSSGKAQLVSAPALETFPKRFSIRFKLIFVRLKCKYRG